MVISKEKFFEILDYLQENAKFEKDLRQLLNKSKRTTDFMDAAMFTDCQLTDYVIDLLELEFEDSDYGWISYWIYDLNFGQNWTPYSIIDSQGKTIRLKTKMDLYSFLIKNLEERKILD